MSYPLNDGGPKIGYLYYIMTTLVVGLFVVIDSIKDMSEFVKEDGGVGLDDDSLVANFENSNFTLEFVGDLAGEDGDGITVDLAGLDGEVAIFDFVVVIFED